MNYLDKNIHFVYNSVIFWDTDLIWIVLKLLTNM